MSGGSFDYLYSKVEDMGQRLSPRSKSEEEIELGNLLKDLSEVLHDVEWYYSSDYSEDQFKESFQKFKAKWLKPQEELSS